MKDDHNSALHAEQVKQLYAMGALGLMVHILCACFLTFALRKFIPHQTLIIWLACSMLIILARYGLLYAYQHTRITPDQSYRWHKLFNIGTALSGIAWGSANIFLFSSDSIVHQVMLTFVLGGLSVGAITTLMPSRRTFLFLQLPILVPMDLRLLAIVDEIHISMGILSTLFTFMVLFVGLRAHKMTITSLKLRFENRDLVEELMQHRDNLEHTVSQRTAELQATKDQFEKYIETSLDPIAISDNEGHIIRTNEAFRKMLGYSVEDLAGKKFLDLSINDMGTYESTAGEMVTIEEAFHAETANALNRLFTDGKVSSWITYYVNKQHKIVPVNQNIVFLYNEKAEQMNSFAIIRDITKQRKADIELITAKENLENLISSSLDPILITDGVGNFVKVNRAMLTMLGYEETALIGEFIATIFAMEEKEYESTTGERVVIDAAFLEKQRKLTEQSFAEGKISNRDAYLLRKDGKIIPTIQNEVLIYGPDKELTGAFGIVRDITEQRKFELALIIAKDAAEAKSKELEQLIATSLDPINISDGTGHLVKANKAFLDMVGSTAEEIIGKPAYEFSITDEGAYDCTTDEKITIGREFFDDAFARTEELFEKGYLSNWTTYFVNSQKKIVPVTQNITFLYSEQGERTGAFAIIRDITKERMAERDLIRAKEVAESGNEAKSNFLANMSHEVRTPLNGVMGFTDMLLETPLNPEQEEYARTIRKSSESLLTILNDILDFSKIEAGKIEIEEMDFDVEMLAYDVCDLIRPRVEESDVKIQCRIGDLLPARVKGDPHRFRQVIVNLMGNAAKFTSHGFIELAADAEQEQDERVLIHITVKDTGIGIAEDKLEAVFTLFQQEDNSTTRKYGGTGLGLTICRRIAALMDGNVWAESIPGVGSNFHFTARLKKSEEKTISHVSHAALEGKKILIADSDQASLDIIVDAVKASGMHVQSYSKGEDALAAMRFSIETKAPFDLCVIDTQLSDMDWPVLVQRIRADISSSMPLLAFSATVEKGEAQRCHEAGCNGFLPKPVHREKLCAMLGRLLVTAGKYVEDESAALVTQHSLREEYKQAARILLAEDNPVNLQLAVKLLTKGGYSVKAVQDGREAVDAFTAEPEKYDIILMDMQMPVLNGYDATREIRAWELTHQGNDIRGGSALHIPIIAMTANALAGDREKCLQAGMDDYIAKPIKREGVFDILKRWVISEQNKPGRQS